MRVAYLCTEFPPRSTVAWGLKAPEKPDLERFGRYLRGKGYMPRTVFMYLDSAGRYLSSGETITDFIDGLHDRYLSRNTINNYILAIKPITGCWASPWMT
jgi:hypothetical protein